MVYYEDEALIDDVSKTNESIALAAIGKSPHDIRGAFVLCLKAGSTQSGRVFSDVAPGTFRHFIDNAVHSNARGIPFSRS